MTRRRTPNSRLPALLTEAGWSRHALAQALNELGRARGVSLRYDRTSVSHWVAGSRPRQPVPALVAQALTARIGRPVTEAETGLVAAWCATDWNLSGGAWGRDPARDPVRRLAALARADADPQQRQALYGLVYDPALPCGPHGAVRRQQVSRRAAEEQPVTAEAVGDMAAAFHQQLERHGGGHARTAVAAYLADDAATALARTREETYGGLLAEVARTAYVCALMCADSNLHGLAQRYHHSALELAAAADDPALEATVLRALSSQASRLGCHRQAFELAVAAHTTAQRCASGPVRASVLARRAAAKAGVGITDTALSDLASAERVLGDSADESFPRLTAYSPGAMRDQEGQMLRALGDTGGAIRAFEASTEYCTPADQRRARVLTRARLTQVRLRAGQVESGCRDYALLLQEAPGLSSPRACSAIDSLRAELRSFRRHPSARMLMERTVGVREPARRPARS
ncbi:hypothetical protein [Streptomyces qinglanensis]|uniref:Transcriptional regulator n=1 Tax=Streptomyces qinglanensis TaxID=943816 RepID=A0A1H9RAC3_9ACTN|nr:hypothetical protein [Streptomyces qinglanensis]SER68873.1 hypothetical protein SAMN05421870_103371 [Streptomyces qinglanensis]